MERSNKVSLAFFIILALGVSSTLVPAYAYAKSYPYSPDNDEVSSALDYLRDQQTSAGDIGGFVSSAWVIMAITSAGENPHDWRIGDNPSIVDYLRTETNPENLKNDPLAYARTVLAISAAGEDPTDFGGTDYLAGLENYYKDNQIGNENYLNDDFWGVMAFIAAGKSPSFVENAVEFIKNHQRNNGGPGVSLVSMGDGPRQIRMTLPLP